MLTTHLKMPGPDQLHRTAQKAPTSHLEQEHVLCAVAAVDGELTRALLGGDDVQLGGKGGDGDQRLARNVGACGGRQEVGRGSRSRQG